MLFADPQPELHQYSFSVGDPVDALSQRVAAAVGFASLQSSVVYRERYAFDKTRCEDPLIHLQSGAHWLVLASRQPLYRAVQQAGSHVASLLDFYTSSERGRAVHVCASLNAKHAGGDLIRLDAVLRTIIGGDLPELGARALVQAALGFAPGLAMRCIGAVTTVEVEGLLGLLLTGQELRRRKPDALVLALDQHQGLLALTGQLGDVLSVVLQDGTIHITVGESKFTTADASVSGDLVEGARGQVRSTVRRLRHLGIQHPLCASVRAKLARAIVHQIHLSGVEQSRTAELMALVTAARLPETPIVIGPDHEGSVHVWSLAHQAEDATSSGDDAAEVFIHGRSATLAELRQMISTSAAA